jgi:hypothetical protein
MRETGRGGSGEEPGAVAGVAVAAAVAVLERQQEEQRGTKPSDVRQRHPIAAAGVSRHSSGSGVGGVRETIARLHSKFSGVGRSGGNGGVSPTFSLFRDTKQDTDEKSRKHVNSVRRNDLPCLRKKEPDNAEVKSNNVVTEEEDCFSDIRKSPSTKNISSLVRNNSVVATLNESSLSSLDSKTQDVQKSRSSGTPVGKSKVEIPFRSTKCLMNDSKGSARKQQFVPKLSTVSDNDRRGNTLPSSSSTESVDRHDGCYDDDGPSVRSATLQNDYQLQNIVKGSTSDSNIGRKRPRVIHLREFTSEKCSRTKSNPELASEGVLEQVQLRGVAESSGSSSGTIVLGYPPPPASLPPGNEDHSVSPFGGASSWSSCQPILASAESLGTHARDGRARTLLS